MTRAVTGTDATHAQTVITNMKAGEIQSASDVKVRVITTRPL